MGVELNIVARTDALSAKLIDSNIDPVDHPFILGVVDPKNPSLLKCFPEAGVDAIKAKFGNTERGTKLLNEWNIVSK